LVRTCSEIIAELVTAIEAGKDINLNGLKNRASRRNKLQHQPKLVEIIAAIPEEHKAALLPKLKAKPVRTASGVSVFLYRNGREDIERTYCLNL
jgi:elongator complex protein 3